MEEQTDSTHGWLATLRRMGVTSLSAFQTRLELFTLELAEERQRLVAALLWTAGTTFFFMLAVLLLTLAIVAACPAPSRPWVLGGFSLLYLALAGGAALGLRKRLREGIRPFSATLEELKKDVDWLRSKS